MDVDHLNESGRQWPSYSGDRILVAKFPYDFADPKRWDVVVFRYPGNSWMNYIKRLVGRPNETVRIRHGDIYIRPQDPAASSSQADGEGFDIARKPPEKVRGMAQTVYDNDFVVDKMTSAGLAAAVAGLVGRRDGGRSSLEITRRRPVVRRRSRRGRGGRVLDPVSAFHSVRGGLGADQARAGGVSTAAAADHRLLRL